MLVSATEATWIGKLEPEERVRLFKLSQGWTGSGNLGAQRAIERLKMRGSAELKLEVGSERSDWKMVQLIPVVPVPVPKVFRLIQLRCVRIVDI